MELITFGLAGLVLVLVYINLKRKDTLSAIPGPFRLPIFGNVQFNFPRLHIQFTEFAQQFGEIYRIQILSQPAIVINSYNAFREACLKKGKDFIGRPSMLRFDVVQASSGIAFRPFSAKQKELRLQGIKVLKMEGLSHLNDIVNDNLSELVQLINQQEGQAFNPKRLIKKFLINIVFSMVFGEKAEMDDPVLEKIIEFNEAAVEMATIGKEDVDVWTWTSPFNPNYAAAVKAKAVFDRNVLPLYQKYKNTYIEGHERGVIDDYITQVRNGKITDEDVNGLLIDYLVGGVETTATTLYGFLLILLRSPKIQEKVQSEIDEVVGLDRAPHISDKTLLPYAEACVLELFRYQNTVPILLPRETVVDTELCGYQIPKGTWVYVNAWAIHHNEEVYPDSMSYKPERFLDSDGQLVSQEHITRKNIVTFGVGGRACIGESLAKNRLFLSLCSLMQRFTFVADERYPPPSSDARHYKLKIVMDIDDYMLRATPRV